MKNCFFIGHRDTPQEVYPILLQTIQHLILTEGVTDFYVGNYGAFDRMVVRAVRECKQHHNITLTALIPYHPTERPITISEGVNGTFYPPGMEYIPRKFAIVKANQYMVDHVDHLVAYAWHPASNARNLLEYAKRRAATGALQIWNIYEIITMK